MKTMKSTVSTLLMLSVLVIGLCLLTSCSAVTEKDLQDDTAVVLGDAWDKTLSAFFTDDAGVRRVVEKASEKGSINLTVDSKDILGGGELTLLSETLYIDRPNNTYVSDTLITFDGEDYTARVWASENRVAMSSADILGTDATYLFDPETFTEGLPGSGLAAYLDMSDEEVAETVRIINAYMEKLEDSPEDRAADRKAFTDKLFATMEQSIDTERIEGEDGETVKYIVATYWITNETIGEVLDLALEEMEASGTYSAEELADMAETFESAETYLRENYDIELVAKIYVNAKAGTVGQITFDGTVKGLEDLTGAILPVAEEETEASTEAAAPDAARLHMTVTFSETEINATTVLGEGDNSTEIKLLLTKQVKDADVTYNAALTYARSGLTIELLTGSCTYNQRSGDLSAKVSLFSGTGLSRMEYSATANLQASRTEATLTMKSVGMKMLGVNQSFTFDEHDVLTLTVKAEDEIPALPEDTKDIITLTEAEWEALEDSFVASPVGILIFGVRLEGTYVHSLDDGGKLISTELTFREDTIRVETFILGFSNTVAEGTYEIRDGRITTIFPDSTVDFSGSFAMTDDAIIIGSAVYTKKD